MGFEDSSILWRRLDHPGHESTRVFLRDDSWHLQGTAVFSYDGLPCRLDYKVVCDTGWRTRRANVNGWVGDREIQIDLTVTRHQNWFLNAKSAPAVAGCIDLDLNFSPSTNLLPIRRLELAVGEEAEVRAAWLRFPSFELEPLAQIYRRVEAATYRYESNGGDFVTELSVNEAGFVTRYPDLWEIDEGRSNS
jgi:hypothetical protein